MFSAYIGANLQSLVEFGDFCYQGHFVTSTPHSCNGRIYVIIGKIVPRYSIVVIDIPERKGDAAAETRPMRWWLLSFVAVTVVSLAMTNYLVCCPQGHPGNPTSNPKISLLLAFF